MLTIDQQICDNNPLQSIGLNKKDFEASKFSNAKQAIESITPNFIDVLSFYNNTLSSIIKNLQTDKLSKKELQAIFHNASALTPFYTELIKLFEKFELDDQAFINIFNETKKVKTNLLEIASISEHYIELIEAREDFNQGDIISLEEAFEDV